MLTNVDQGLCGPNG